MNDLIEIKHSDNTRTFVRRSDILIISDWNDEKSIEIERGDNIIKLKLVANIDEIIEAINSTSNNNSNK